MSNHRKTVRRFHETGDCHELTFSCYRRLPLLMDDDRRTQFVESIDRAMIGQACHLIAYVLMPEHVHLLVQPKGSEARIDLLLKAIKAPFSSRLKRRLEGAGDPLLDKLTVRERPGVFCFRFWQEGGGYDRNLRSPLAVVAAMDYIHENPVRRGLCQFAVDWRWSSARHFRDDCEPSTVPAIHKLSWDLFE